MYKWRNESQYLLRYATAGVFNTIVGVCGIFVMTAAGWSSFAANGAGFAFGLVLSFATSRRFVFRSNQSVRKDATRYLLAFFVAFLVNLGTLHLLLSNFNIHVLFAQAGAVVSYATTLYALNRTFVFSHSDQLRDTKDV